MRLTDRELHLLNLLATVWNEFLELPNRSPSDNDEFERAIHAAQAKIALRVARRVDPSVWYQPD